MLEYGLHWKESGKCPVARICGHSSETSGSIETRNFLLTELPCVLKHPALCS
jgi:hypothetical protein